MYATISPVTVYPNTATMLFCPEVMIQNLGVATRAVATYALRADDGSTCLQGTCVMSDAVYALWGADDAYVFNWLASELSLTILEIIDLPLNQLATDPQPEPPPDPTPPDPQPEPTPEPTPDPDPTPP